MTNIINKYVKSKLTPKMIIQGLTYYNDPQMSFVDELLDSKVDYFIVPFNIENYARYIDEMYDNKLDYRKYSPDFVEAINKIFSDDAYKQKAEEISSGFKRCSGAKGAADKILQVCK